MTFRAIKTGDIVWHQGQKHLVVSVDIDQDDIKLQLQPLAPTIKTVSHKDVAIDSGLKVSNLKINSQAKNVWMYSAKKAQSDTIQGIKTGTLRSPFLYPELVNGVKNLLLKELADSNKTIVDQGMLDRITLKLISAQAYLVGGQINNASSIKSNIVYPGWRSIARTAHSMATKYNSSFKGLTISDSNNNGSDSLNNLGRNAVADRRVPTALSELPLSSILPLPLQQTKQNKQTKQPKQTKQAKQPSQNRSNSTKKDNTKNNVLINGKQNNEQSLGSNSEQNDKQNKINK